MGKLKLLELFGGIGACSQALEQLGIDFEIVDYVDNDKFAVRSFNAIHDSNFEVQDITQWDKQIDVDLIMHGSPCQDFSLAGLQAGGDEGSGTRSSLMYETLRIVEKLKPKYVIWENVKNIISKKHVHNFNNYINRMSELGYKSFYKVLNAKDYGIPQNRERVFTVSILDGSDYEFPKPMPLKLKLKDMLEDEVDEKYFLSDAMMNCFMSDGTGNYPRKERFRQNINRKNQDIGNTITSRAGDRPTDNFVMCKTLRETLETNEIPDGVNMIDGYNRNIRNDELSGSITTRIDASNNTYLAIKNATKKGYLEAEEGDGVDISSRMQHHRGTVQKEMIQTLDSQGGNSKGVVIKKDTPNYIEWEEEGKFESDCRAYKEDKISGAIVSTPKNKVLLKEKLCNELIEQGMVEENDVIRHSYSNSRMNNFYKQNSVNNNVSPTLDTRCDCLGVTVKTIGNYSPSNHNASRVVDNDGLAPTVMENHGTVTATNVSNLRIRKLTPKECWRLMGFSDEAYEKAAQVNSNSQLYKQAGNSIVVNVLTEVLRNLLLKGDGNE